MGRKYFNIIALICIISGAQPVMADPLTISLVATAMWASYAPVIIGATVAIAGIATGVTSAVVSAQQQKAQADYMAEVNNVNAASARSQAQAKIQQQRIQSRFLQGTQLAKLGSMGVTADSGSTLMLLGQTAGQERYDEEVTKWQGETQAISFQNQAALNEYQGQMADWNLGLNIASTTVKSISAGISAGAGAGTLLTGAGSTVNSSFGGQAFALGIGKSTISSDTAGYFGNLSGVT